MPRALNISEAAAIALHTMAALAAEPQTSMTTREIAAKLRGSEAHLSKVLQRLAKAGFVNAKSGPRGGYSLALAADEIIMLEVFEAIDGPIDCCCTQSPAVCDGRTCVFGQLVTIVNKQVRDYLGGIRLSELHLEGPGRLIRFPANGKQPVRKSEVRK